MNDTPNHLRPIQLAGVNQMGDRIRLEVKMGPHDGLYLELVAFEETRTVHDGRRLANALRHVANRPDLANEVSALIGDCPCCGAGNAANCRLPACLWTNGPDTGGTWP